MISRPQEVDEGHLSFIKLKVIIRNVLLTEIDWWPFNAWIIACTERYNILPLWVTDTIPLIVSPYLSEIFWDVYFFYCFKFYLTESKC